MTDQAPHIEYTPLSALKPWDKNPKLHDIRRIKESISAFGFVSPIVVNETTGKLVAGHGRLEALTAMRDAGEPPPLRIHEADGDWLVPVLRGVAFDDDTQAAQFALIDNKLTELGGWSDIDLGEVLHDLQLEDVDLDALGWEAGEELDKLLDPFDTDNGSDGDGDGDDNPGSPISGAGSLSERFIVPPFSVLDARQGYWQERKRAWLSLGIQSEIGRGGGLTWHCSPTHGKQGPTTKEG
jgi:hypothetical protein